MSAHRGTWRAVVAAVAAMMTMPAAALGAVATTTTFQADAAHDGYVYGAGVVPPLTRAWSASLVGANVPDVDSHFPIDNGQVFALKRATSNGPLVLQARRLSSGTVDWSAKLANSTFGTQDLTVDNGTVFVAYTATYPSSGYVDGLLAAYSESTGAYLWTTPLPGQPFPTAPITANHIVYLDADGEGSTVYALAESTGAIKWSTDLDAGNPVTLAGNVLVTSSACGLAYGLNPSTGAVLWRDYNGCDGGGTFMAAYDGTDVWGDQGGNQPGYVLQPANGSLVKQFSGYAPAFGYGEAVQASPQSSGAGLEIDAFTPSDLSVRWTFTEPATSGNRLGSDPLLADGYVFAEGGQAQVWALNPCSGAIDWHGSAGSAADTVGYDPLPSLSAGDGYLAVPTARGLTVFRGAGQPPSAAPRCSSS